MSILSLRNIVKCYASHTALNDVSLELPEQSIFGLLGPNGAGKTTLIRIINQIIAPDSGQIFLGQELLHPRHTALIGYLPEERGLYKKMQVAEQVLYLAQLKGLSRPEAVKRLKYWFEKFEMQTWWKKKVEELSKGMQQKVQFVITVIHEPKLLILDEPFTGFDPINANLIRNELLELRKKGATILLSTHRMESVEELCTHIALIHQSKKVLDGEVASIRKAYRTHTYEVEYSGNAIAFAHALGADFEVAESSRNGEHSIAKIKLLHGNTTNSLLNALLPHVNIHSFREILPGINDIFISIVSEQQPT